MVNELQQLAQLPESVQATIPFLPPPPGVTPNFANPASVVPFVTGLNTTFLGLATIFIGLRIYMKAFVVKNWRIEDSLLVPAYIFAVIFYSTGILACYRGAMGRHSWEVHMNTQLYDGWFYAVWVQDAFPLLPVGLTKVAILCQYLHLFSSKSGVRFLIISGIVVISIFYFSWTIIFIIFTSPWPGESIYDLVTSWHANMFIKWSAPIGVIGVIFDWYVLLLPIPLVLRLQLSPAKKLGVLLIFMTGGLACGASMASVVYRYRVDITDPTMGLAYIFVWGQLEMWAGIIAASAPTVHQFWNRQSKLVWLSDVFKSSLSHLSGRSGRSAGHGSHGSGHSRRPDLGTVATAEDQQRMVKVSPSMESARAPTLTYPESVDMGGAGHHQKRFNPQDQIFVERSFTVTGTSSHDSDTDVDIEAQRTENEVEKKWPL